MGGLAHFIERAGVATTSISLIREHTQALKPPRALWVPFPLGRPLGVAGDADFQRQVLRASLSLLDTATEPVIADYPEEAVSDYDPASWVCPINLPPPDVDPGSVEQRLLAELARLAPWAGQTRRERGRTLFGASGAKPEQVDTLGIVMSRIAEGGPLFELPPEARAIDWLHPMPLLLRHIADDLRTFYHESVAAKPGKNAPTHDALNEWIFGQTVFGLVLSKVAEVITAAGDRRLLTLRGYLIPEGYVPGDESFGRRQEGDPPGFLRAVAANQLLRGETDS